MCLLLRLADKETPPEAGARERAYALTLACRHLPSQMYSAPGQKVGMVQDAIGALKRLGVPQRSGGLPKIAAQS